MIGLVLRMVLPSPLKLKNLKLVSIHRLQQQTAEERVTKAL